MLTTRSVVRIAIAAFALFVSSPTGAAPNFPALTGRVVDEAGILSDTTKAQLTSLLADEEKTSSVQLVVVTLKSLQGDEIEEFGYQLGRHWAIGQKGKNNGVLLIVAPNEHKTRIEVGYGLEGRLTDLQCKLIIDQVLLPAFKRGDYDAGIIDGTRAILKVIGGGNIAPLASSDAGNVPAGIGMTIIVVLVLFSITWPLLLFFYIFSFFRRLHLAGGTHASAAGSGFHWADTSSSSSSSSWDSSSSSGSDDFSGGGGDFGGGGASGSW